MEQLVNEIRLGYEDAIINDRLASPRVPTDVPYALRYNQSEELFIELAEPFTVPRFPIHHDVRERSPRADYIQGLRGWIESLMKVAPDFFSDLTYFFDPGETLKPCFFKLYRCGENHYLYLLRVNLAFRPLESELLERGGNDETSSYRSRRLYLDSDFIPLEAIVTENDRPTALVVKQVVSQTWIGETGKGYFLRGIWMDTELTKFFSKLFLTPGKRSYPFYPFTCKYKTVCMTVPNPVSEVRKRLLPYLHAAIGFLAPEMERIQAELKGADFSESLPIFTELRAKANESLREPWTDVRVTPYLNADEQKEFRVEF
jgi:hypothetical protein